MLKGRLPAVMFMGGRGKTKSTKCGGPALERSRGHSFLTAGGKAEEMAADDGGWTDKVWAMIYQHHQISTEHCHCYRHDSRLPGFKSPLTICVVLARFLNLPVPQFSHL